MKPPDARRCSYVIEKDWPGHRAVLSRRRCGKWARPGTDRCFVHPRPISRAAGTTAEGEEEKACEN